MSDSENWDIAFEEAGKSVGIEIWRIENFQPVPLPKSDHGKFYSGDSYVVLKTSEGKGGAYVYDIHFWIGKNTSQDESGTAAIKTVELDASLGDCATQHRELQGFESDKFLSYFSPCLVTLDGGVASGFKAVEEEDFEPRLYTCKGKKNTRLKQVPLDRSSLNQDDVFILDTEEKLYQFNGATSNISERAKAFEVIQHLKDDYHKGTCDVAVIDGGEEAESESSDFWASFGGFGPIACKAAVEDDVPVETTTGDLYSITDGLQKVDEATLTQSLLETNKCYLLDCQAEVFVWIGRATKMDDRKDASRVSDDFVRSNNKPKSTRITRITEGYETVAFKSHFESWEASAGAD